MMKWLNKKKEDLKNKKGNKKDSLKVKKNKYLPKDFHKRVMELENQCERPDANKWHINDLMDLYTVIFYYNDYHSKQLSIIIAKMTQIVKTSMKLDCILYLTEMT